MTSQIPFDPDFDQVIKTTEPKREAPSETVENKSNVLVNNDSLNSRRMFIFGMVSSLVVGSLLGNFILIKLIIK